MQVEKKAPEAATPKKKKTFAKLSPNQRKRQRKADKKRTRSAPEILAERIDRISRSGRQRRLRRKAEARAARK